MSDACRLSESSGDERAVQELAEFPVGLACRPGEVGVRFGGALLHHRERLQNGVVQDTGDVVTGTAVGDVGLGRTEQSRLPAEHRSRRAVEQRRGDDRDHMSCAPVVEPVEHRPEPLGRTDEQTDTSGDQRAPGEPDRDDRDQRVLGGEALGHFEHVAGFEHPAVDDAEADRQRRLDDEKWCAEESFRIGANGVRRRGGSQSDGHHAPPCRQRMTDGVAFGTTRRNDA